MVELGTAGVNHQRTTELLAKHLVGMADQQHIMLESLQALRPAGLFFGDEIAVEIQQLDAIHVRIGWAGMHHVETLAFNRQLNNLR